VGIFFHDAINDYPGNSVKVFTNSRKYLKQKAKYDIYETLRLDTRIVRRYL